MKPPPAIGDWRPLRGGGRYRVIPWPLVSEFAAKIGPRGDGPRLVTGKYNAWRDGHTRKGVKEHGDQ